VRRLVFRVDCDGKRFDSVHVQVRHFLYVARLFRFGAAHFFHALLVETIKKMNKADNQHADEDEGEAAAEQSRVEKRRRRAPATCVKEVQTRLSRENIKELPDSNAVNAAVAIVLRKY
jgi:hypothetical protein